jgi:hypothetical protein
MSTLVIVSDSLQLRLPLAASPPATRAALYTRANVHVHMSAHTQPESAQVLGSPGPP